MATGFDIEPLPTGEILIEFSDNDDVTFNSQVMISECSSKNISKPLLMNLRSPQCKNGARWSQCLNQ